ncbi:unnamed protein product [Allacma fusca]|uniref:G-protein coupled receptors family 1 profile domain-containing protein n=1 Tax=Allacma fusca TaxID=39272 RepID=A0A8J2KBP7_9HEXA|nr:unnamed protein product [Allacma fusca]
MNNSSFPNDFELLEPALDTTQLDLPYLRHSLEWTILLIIAYSSIFIIGFIGNMCVVLVVVRTKSMRTVTNLFILNLAIADLLVIIFCIPSTLLSNILIPWVLGWWMCKTVNYIQGVSVCASVYSLVAISLDKFLGIWFPMKKGMAKRRARIIIGLIWVIASVVILPWALVFDLVEVGDSSAVTYCVEVWPAEVNGDLYFLLGNLLACYLLPLGGISLCYALIWFRVIQRKVPKETASVANVKKIHRKTKLGVLKMLMVVILVFLLSWLPLYVIFTRIKFCKNLEEWEERLYSIATPLAQWLGSSNSCINPILYTFLNAKFRRAFLTISPCRRAQKKVPTLQRRHAIKSSYHVRKHVSFGGVTGV